jgi:hypothetical protein
MGVVGMGKIHVPAYTQGGKLQRVGVIVISGEFLFPKGGIAGGVKVGK